MMNPVTEIQLGPRLSDWVTKSWLVRLTIRFVLVPAILFSTASFFSTSATKDILIVRRSAEDDAMHDRCHGK
ncbi:MAG: hypothetical protein ACFB16_06125 [Phormidesmis sp.]